MKSGSRRVRLSAMQRKKRVQGTQKAEPTHPGAVWKSNWSPGATAAHFITCEQDTLS